MNIQDLKKTSSEELISKAEKLGTDKTEIGMVAYSIRD